MGNDTSSPSRDPAEASRSLSARRRPLEIAALLHRGRPFHYRSAEDRVPWDAVYVIISITVVPPRAFLGHQHLKRVELQEGVEAIGAKAFQECPNLTHVVSSSSLVTIGDWAFAGCRRLSEVTLREGLRRIGKRAFKFCESLRRIVIPASVEEIGEGAFNLCRWLSEATLREGLRRIGVAAFNGCALGRIAVPSSVEEIGKQAFAGCLILKEVTLAGGTVMVARGAFNCPRLERIAISSAAIVVEAGEDGNGRVAVVTGGIERDPSSESPRLILASPHLTSMRPEDLADLTERIDRIADATRGAGPFLADGDVSGRMRECFVDHVSTWHRWYKGEVAAILELGLWKMELRRAGELSSSCAAGEGETAGADVLTRVECRCKCGADPIVGLVLSSLAGPHRRHSLSVSKRRSSFSSFKNQCDLRALFHPMPPNIPSE